MSSCGFITWKGLKTVDHLGTQVANRFSDEFDGQPVEMGALSVALGVELIERLGANPVATTLRIIRVNTSETFNWPAVAVVLRIVSQRNTATGSPHRSFAQQYLAGPHCAVAVGQVVVDCTRWADDNDVGDFGGVDGSIWLPTLAVDTVSVWLEFCGERDANQSTVPTTLGPNSAP